jgi:hypothetical protein
MRPKYDILRQEDQEAEGAAQELLQLLETFLATLLYGLDQVLDKRLVGTLVQMCVFFRVGGIASERASMTRRGERRQSKPICMER